MNTAVSLQQQNRQSELEIKLGDCEFPAIVDYTYIPAIHDIEVSRCLFNVTENFWATLDRDHFGLVESQLRQHLTSEASND